MWKTSDAPHSSAHFVVGQDGTVVQCVRLTDVAYHAHQANSDSVGIEHSDRKKGELGPNDPGLPPNPTQLEASARLVVWLLEQCGLEPTRDVIKGHGEVDPETTHTDCPDSIDLNAYVGLVAALYALPPTPDAA
jgi:N-acetyl-anhydromuramyl-L-alanine amidase AmpD